MAIVFENWLNTNEGRSYPLHDSAGRNEAGSLLPNNLLVDCQIWLPKSVGNFVCVSSASVSERLVTLTFVAIDDSPICGTPSTDFVPIAVLSLIKPVVKFKNYALKPLVNGVGGWVQLGSAVSNGNFSIRFTDSAQGLLCDRAVRTYEDLPVTSLAKKAVSPALRGLVRLQGVPGEIRVQPGVRTIGGVERNVILIGQDVESNKVDKLLGFAGTCGHRPSAGTCNTPPVISISDVKPNCDGNINLIFDGDVVVGDTGDGLVLDSPLGLSDLCKPQPYAPIDTNDCEPEFSSSSSEQSEDVEDPAPFSSSSSSLDAEYCESFFDDPTELTTMRGEFNVVDGRFVSSGVSGEDISLNLVRRVDVESGYNLRSIIHPKSGQYEGHVIFGAVVPPDLSPPTNFFFCGLTFAHPQHPYGCFFLGRRVASAAPDAQRIGLGQPGSNYIFLDPASIYDIDEEDALTEDDYYFDISVVEAGSFILVDWSVKWSDKTTGVISSAISVIPSMWTARNSKGKVGLGALNSSCEFDSFGVNCESSSSSF